MKNNETLYTLTVYSKYYENGKLTKTAYHEFVFVGLSGLHSAVKSAIACTHTLEFIGIKKYIYKTKVSKTLILR